MMTRRGCRNDGIFQLCLSGTKIDANGNNLTEVVGKTIAFCIPDHFSLGAIPIVDLIACWNAFGASAVILTPSHDDSVPKELVKVVQLQQMKSADWWSSASINCVVCYSFNFPEEICRAANAGGVTTILFADSHGMESVRLWPLQRLRYYKDDRDSIAVYLRKIKLFVQDFLNSRRNDQRTLSRLACFDGICVETELAKKHLIDMCEFYGSTPLIPRLNVVPFCVPRDILNESAKPTKAPLVLIAGRLSLGQKDPGKLARLSRLILEKHEDVEIVCCSRGECSELKSLQYSFDGRFRYQENLPKPAMATLLKDARVIVSASRWETLPVMGIEALCMGATIVAPPLDGYVDLVQSGRYGTIAESSRISHLLQAFGQEWACWQTGRRMPVQIATENRVRFSPSRIGELFLRNNFATAQTSQVLTAPSKT